MNDIYSLIEQIPVRHDLISSFVLLGIVLMFLIVIVIFLRTKKSNHAIRLLGYLLLLIGLISVDNYSCYTGMMKHALHLNDSTEVFTLLLGPFVYFLIRAFVRKKGLKWKWDVIHFIIPFAYVILQLGYYISPIANKYNAYINAYHPELPWYDMTYNKFFLFGDILKSEFRLIVIASFIVYLILSIKVYFGYNQVMSASSNTNRSKFSKSILVFAFLANITVLLVFLNFSEDLGDHFISIYLTIVTILIASFLMAESRFFERSWIADKYETSGLKNVSEGLFARIEELVDSEKYYLNKNTSLRDLAEKLNSSPNYISQAINKEKGINFNEFINRYRIKEAVKRLNDENYKHYNIESIGETVGFNAKTTFYAAFKKQMGLTPSAYLKSLKSDS